MPPGMASGNDTKVIIVSSSAGRLIKGLTAMSPEQGHGRPTAAYLCRFRPSIGQDRSNEKLFERQVTEQFEITATSKSAVYPFVR